MLQSKFLRVVEFHDLKANKKNLVKINAKKIIYLRSKNFFSAD